MNGTRFMDNYYTTEPSIAARSKGEEQCLPSGLKQLCIVLACICILLAAILGVLCFYILLKYRRKVYGGRKKRTQEFLERKYGEYFYPILFGADENGTFAQSLNCPICRHTATGNFDLCIHFKRMKKFRIFEENNRIARELINNRQQNKKKAAGSNASNTTMDLNELMKQYPFITSSCSMLYSAYSYHSSEDVSLSLMSNRMNKSISSRRSFVENLFEPVRNLAEKFSFSNVRRSRSFVKSSTPIPLHFVADGGDMQIFEVGQENNPWTVTPKPEFRRWSAQSLSPNEDKFLSVTSYSNPAAPVSRDLNICYPVGYSSLKRKRESCATRAVVHNTPKIVVHPSTVINRPVFELEIGEGTLNKKHSISLQHLTVSQKNRVDLLPPTRHSVSSFDGNDKRQLLKPSSSFGNRAQWLGVPGDNNYTNRSSNSFLHL